MKKEWMDINSMFYSFQNLQAGVLPILFLSGALAVYEPIKIGPEWLQTPIMMVSFVVLIPFAVIGFISPNSIVGERIQRTLEPLLATPVTDQAILFGKIGAAVVYGWGITLINMLLGLVVINISFAGGEVLLYPTNMLAPIILLSLLFSFLVAIWGVNFSLYAASLLDAMNNLAVVLFVPMLVTAFMGSPVVPKTWQAMLAKIIPFYGVSNPFLTLILILLIVDCLLMVVVLIRFRRKRLIMGSNHG